MAQDFDATEFVQAVLKHLVMWYVLFDSSAGLSNECNFLPGATQ